jgi:hypothetical protein
MQKVRAKPGTAQQSQHRVFLIGLSESARLQLVDGPIN